MSRLLVITKLMIIKDVTMQVITIVSRLNISHLQARKYSLPQ